MNQSELDALERRAIELNFELAHGYNRDLNKELKKVEEQIRSQRFNEINKDKVQHKSFWINKKT